jgi:hypothetical protein
MFIFKNSENYMKPNENTLFSCKEQTKFDHVIEFYLFTEENGDVYHLFLAYDITQCPNY